MLPLLLAAGYVFTEVFVPGASVMSNFWGPNDKGQVILTSDIGDGFYKDGTFTPLPDPPAGYFVSPHGINNAGTIVGSAFAPPDFQEQGFILTGSAYTFFSRPGWQFTEPRGIGNSGLVTGWNSEDASNRTAGFVYDPRTNTFTDATPPGSLFTITQGINKSGVISGSGRDASTGTYAFIWQQGTFTKGKSVVPFIDRFEVANRHARARGINDTGIVVGYTDSTGFVGNSVRGFELLKVPGATDVGLSTTFCEGINNSGQVTCGYIDDSFNFHAFIGSPRGGDDRDDDHDK